MIGGVQIRLGGGGQWREFSLPDRQIGDDWHGIGWLVIQEYLRNCLHLPRLNGNKVWYFLLRWCTQWYQRTSDSTVIGEFKLFSIEFRTALIRFWLCPWVPGLSGILSSWPGILRWISYCGYHYYLWPRPDPSSPFRISPGVAHSHIYYIILSPRNKWFLSISFL